MRTIMIISQPDIKKRKPVKRENKENKITLTVNKTKKLAFSIIANTVHTQTSEEKKNR